MKVYNEIEIWRRLENKNLIKLYQIINDSEKEKLFLVMQMGDLGQLMKWDEDLLKYQMNKEIYNCVKKKLQIANPDEFKELEAITKYIFKEIGEGIKYLHIIKHISHRDIKLDNIICKSDGNTTF